MCNDTMNGRGIPRLLEKMKTVISFGNPLLDTTVYIDDTSLLDKYNLKADEQIEIPENKMRNLSKDISGYKQKHSAGGCSQNSLRMLQWLLHKQCKAVAFGSVGKDKEATILKDLLRRDGVQTRYTLQDNLPTGRSINLVKGSSIKSLVAYIGAAEQLSINQLMQIQDVHDLLQECNFVYVEGFFLTNRTETAKYVLDFCNKHNKTMLFNICAPYICELYPEAVQYFVENTDIVFGNKHEFEALLKIMKLESIEELKNRLFTNGKNKMKEYGKMIIITDGSKPGTCIYEGGKIEHFEVPLVEEEDIVDTTGAGDAFTGGFIAGLCKNKSIKECTKIGCYSAFHIVKQAGFTLPNFQPDILK